MFFVNGSMGQAVVLQLAFYAGTIHLSKGDGEMSENDYSATGATVTEIAKNLQTS